MVSRPGLTTLVGQLLLFGCGGAAVAAWRGGLYASMILVVLIGLWLATQTLLRALRDRPMASTAAGRPAGDEAERAVLSAVLDQAPTPLLAIDAVGRVRVLNRAARTLFGVEDLLLSAPPALRDAPRLTYAGRSYRVDRIEAQVAGATRTLLALIDIEREERIAEARATRDLLQVLSHEVMNALAPIASLADSALATLDERPPPVDRLRDMVGTMSRRASGLLTFTQGYRQLARLPEPAPAPVAAPLLFDDLARMFAARWGDRVALIISPPPAVDIDLDRDQISQALWALMQNGAEAAETVADGAPQVRLALDCADGVVFRISDNGPGVPDQSAGQLFKPFFTTKPEGTGVGLSLARQIARAHGGDVVLAKTHPTEFELRLRNALP